MEKIPSLLFVNKSYENRIRAFELVSKTKSGLYAYRNKESGCIETFSLFDIQCLASPIRPSKTKYDRTPRMCKYIRKGKKK